jgi:transcriptional regulator with XRE-family HTH domain
VKTTTHRIRIAGIANHLITQLGENATTEECLDHPIAAGGYNHMRGRMAEMFGMAVALAREDRNLSLRQGAAIVAKSRDWMRDVEQGRVLPSKEVCQRLLDHYGPLVNFKAPFLRCFETLELLFDRENIEAAGESVAPPEPSPLAITVPPPPTPTASPQSPPPPPPPREKPDERPARQPFHIALYLLRTAAKFSHEDVGILVGVHATAVGNWENRIFTPTRENYQKLCECFPELARHQIPPTRDIQKPGHPPMTPAAMTNTPKIAAPPASPSPSSARDLFAMQRLLKRVGKSAEISDFRALLQIAAGAEVDCATLLELLED